MQSAVFIQDMQMVFFIIIVSSVFCCAISNNNNPMHPCQQLSQLPKSKSICGIEGSEGKQISVCSIPKTYFTSGESSGVAS